MTGRRTRGLGRSVLLVALVWGGLGLPAELEAQATARVPSTGRIVQAFVRIQHPAGRWRPSTHIDNAGMMYSDDDGETWHSVDWSWPHVPKAIAFDRESLFGVAVGQAGYVWSTEDGGLTWRDRRSDSGVVYTQVAVLGRIAVFADSSGQVYRSRDGGFRRTSLVESDGVQLETTDEAIVVKSQTGEILVRVLASGTVVRP